MRSSRVEHIQGQTFHGRKGAIANAFRYGVDFLLLDAETAQNAPRLFRRNRRGLVALRDRDHGGAPGQGRGASWARDVLAAHQVPGVARIDLLAQPRVLGHTFNPVSFWLCHAAAGDLIAVITEVTNTVGDRHSYLVRHPDHRAIEPHDRLPAVKVFHVSPFQPIAGGYQFRFDITAARIGIWIDFTHEGGGVMTNLTGRRAPLTNRGLASMLLRRPLGSRRVFTLILWQALKLSLKKARFRRRPEPPKSEVT